MSHSSLLGARSSKLTIAQCPSRLTSYLPPPNYGTVERGAISRSGFPKAKNLEFLESLNIRSILYVLRAHSRVDLFADCYAALWWTRSHARTSTGSWTCRASSVTTSALLQTRTADRWNTNPFATRSSLQRNPPISQCTSTAIKASTALDVWWRVFASIKDGQWRRS